MNLTKRQWRQNNLQKSCNMSTLLLTVAILSASCTIGVNDPLSESTTVTFSQPDFWLKPESSFYWHSDLTFFFNDARKKPGDVRPFLQQEIHNWFLARNYTFPADKNQATYGLVAVVVLGEGATAADILKKFDLTPAFKADRRYEKGTIVVAILDAATKQIMWRGALQANVDLKLAPEVRQQRVREGINRLFKKLPRQRPVN